jgi:hypothetical protein
MSQQHSALCEQLQDLRDQEQQLLTLKQNLASLSSLNQQQTLNTAKLLHTLLSDKSLFQELQQPKPPAPKNFFLLQVLCILLDP